MKFVLDFNCDTKHTNLFEALADSLAPRLQRSDVYIFRLMEAFLFIPSSRFVEPSGVEGSTSLQCRILAGRGRESRVGGPHSTQYPGPSVARSILRNAGLFLPLEGEGDTRVKLFYNPPYYEMDVARCHRTHLGARKSFNVMTRTSQTYRQFHTFNDIPQRLENLDPSIDVLIRTLRGE